MEANGEKRSVSICLSTNPEPVVISGSTVPEFLPPVDIDACAGVLSVHNVMLGRVEKYLEETLGA